MGGSLGVLRDAITKTIFSPAQDPTRTLFVISILLVALLIIVLALLIIATPRQRKVIKIRRYRVRQGAEAERVVPESAPPVAPAKRPRRALSPRAVRVIRIVGTWGFPVVLLAAVLSAYFITGSNAYCARTCHVNQVSVAHADKLDHASCVQCHEQPGLAALPQNLSGRISMVVGKIRGTSSSGAVVSSQSCLGCHEKDTQRVTTSSTGIRMSHAATYAAGMACTSCHGQAGHALASTVTMSECVVCHDSKTASADCLTCHTAQPLAVMSKASTTSTTQVGSGLIPYPLVDVPSGQCGVCHDLARQCDTCHGLRMPHSAEFTKGGHAPIAAFTGKNLCWKCHQSTDCLRCHTVFNSHAPNWRKSHQAYPWNSSCSCHGANGCYLCHSRTPPHAVLR